LEIPGTTWKYVLKLAPNVCVTNAYMLTQWAYDRGITRFSPIALQPSWSVVYATLAHPVQGT